MMLRFTSMKVIGVYALSFVIFTSATSQATTDSPYVGGTPHDKVVSLGLDTFAQALEEDPANTIWFLKFYAPWCGHCKRMAPVLDRVAPQIAGTMAIGKIDCTVEKKLCDKYKIRGFPTLKFAVDGELYDYPGARDEKSIIGLANKMSGPEVSFVSSYEQALEYAAEKSEEGVVFVGYDPDAKGETAVDSTRSTTFGQVYSQVARKKKAVAHFLWLQVPPESTKDIFEKFQIGEVRSEDGLPQPFVNRLEAFVQPRYWEPTSAKQQDLASFVQQQNIPLVAVLGPSNFQRFGRLGRPLVIGVVDFSKAEQANTVKRELTEYVSSAPKEDVENYFYGVIDGTKWGKFLDQFNINQNEIPQFFILDVPTKTFWQNATYPTVKSFIHDVKDGVIPSQSSVYNKASGFLGKLEHAFISYFPYSLLVVVGIVFGLVFMLVPTGSNDTDTPYYVDEFDEDLLNEIPEEGDETDSPKEFEKKKDK